MTHNLSEDEVCLWLNLIKKEVALELFKENDCKNQN
jgi:hypothetical protein